MACRIKKQPLLLIDFMDAFNVDMFKIAELFKIFSKQIPLRDDEHITVIDPSIFISKFCEKLEFGDKETEVRDTAIRLI